MELRPCDIVRMVEALQVILVRGFRKLAFLGGPMASTSVLIVGGSLNGLTMALLLAHHGVPCVLVERHRDTTVQYKFSGISPRSMFIYRCLGTLAYIRANRTGDLMSGLIARAASLSSPDVHFQGKP